MWTAKTGNVKASVWPDAGNGSVWQPCNAEEDELFKLPGVCEIGSCGAQAYHLLIEADSIEELIELVRQNQPKIIAIVRSYSGRRH